MTVLSEHVCMEVTEDVLVAVKNPLLVREGLHPDAQPGDRD